jgi:F420-0:gamma-glutamyl ligase-like protein
MSIIEMVLDELDDDTMRVLGPMLGIDEEKLHRLREVAKVAAKQERAKTLMLRRIYKFIQKLDPAKYAEVLADEKKGKEGN